MPETLLTPSSIKIFGRIMCSLQYSDNTTDSRIGGDNFLQNQLSSGQFYSIVPATAGTIGPNQVVTLASLGLIVPGMLVTGAYPYAPGAGVAPAQAFWPGTYVVSVTPETPAVPAFPGNPAIPPTKTTPAYPAAPGTAAVAPQPASFTVSAAPLAGPGTQVALTLWSPPVNLARIYGFTFEGAFYGLPKPSIFIVHGSGTRVGSWGYPSTLDQSGVAAREWDFSGPTNYNANGLGTPPIPPQGPNDLWYWEYEKGDFSIRFDTEAGPFEQILLVAMLRAGADMADRATPRSGASLSGASLAGASLSGASLSGASLSGASLSGASLSGASLRGR
jgi:hypothetical protein